MPAGTFADLDAQGLNLQAVFNLADLPLELRQQLPPDMLGGYRQLLLIGHRGRLLWQQVQQAQPADTDPIDSFTQTQVEAWLQRRLPGVRHAWVYPGAGMIGLQHLGALAGWHHPSPFMVGVHAAWGSWFAYRAVLLLDADLPPTPPLIDPAPCPSCASRACVAACPADALNAGQFSLAACSGYRLQPASPCAEGCLARQACPVGAEHRYETAQIAHSYRRSLAMLRQYLAQP